MKIVYIVFAIVAVAFTGLQLLRIWDESGLKQSRQALLKQTDVEPDVFNVDMVKDLPDAARRYFLFSILPGTPLKSVAEIDMTGELGMGDKSNPGYMAMSAKQILASPSGFIWKVKAGSASLFICGSDGQFNDDSWTRFWLLNAIPVVRAGHNQDHARSSFGRLVAESVFWTPAALLPQFGVTWETIDHDTARATVKQYGFKQSIELTVADDGRPLSVVLQRWSKENADQQWRWQPFGGTLSAFRNFEGYNVATHIEGGNHFGTDEYFPFFKADVSAISFH